MNSAPPSVDSGRHAQRGGGLMLLLGLLMLLGAAIWMVTLSADGKSDRPVPAPETPPVTVADVPMQVDEAFGIALKGVAMRRIVQILQWREVASVPLAADDEVAEDQGAYQLVWSAKAIDSSGFSDAGSHANPELPPYRSQTFGAVPSAGGSADWQPVEVGRLELPENLSAVLRPEGPWLVSTPENSRAEAGDFRLRYDILPLVAVYMPSTTSGDAAADDPLAQALAWIALAAAFIIATLGAGLVLLGSARIRRSGGVLARANSAGFLGIAVLVAILVSALAISAARLL